MAFVQQAQASTASGTSVVATFPAPVTAGNALIATCSTADLVAITAISFSGGGVTWAQRTGAITNHNMGIFDGFNSSGGQTTVTMTATGADVLIFSVAEYSGLDGTITGTIGNGTSASATSATVTMAGATTVANALIYCGFSPAVADTLNMNDVSFTNLTNKIQSGFSVNAAHKTVALTGTFALNNWSWTTAGAYEGFIVAYKVALSGFGDDSFIRGRQQVLSRGLYILQDRTEPQGSLFAPYSATDSEWQQTRRTQTSVRLAAVDYASVPGGLFVTVSADDELQLDAKLYPRRLAHRTSI